MATSVHVCNILGNVVPFNVVSSVHFVSRVGNILVSSVHFGSISHQNVISNDHLGRRLTNVVTSEGDFKCSL